MRLVEAFSSIESTNALDGPLPSGQDQEVLIGHQKFNIPPGPIGRSDYERDIVYHPDGNFYIRYLDRNKRVLQIQPLENPIDIHISTTEFLQDSLFPAQMNSRNGTEIIRKILNRTSPRR